MSNEKIRQIQEAADIKEVVGEYVRLRRAGKNWVGLCPFHADKKPSFTVSEHKQLFHCFGCGVSGNVFTFVMKIKGLTFAEAVLDLASRYNIDVSPADLSAGEKKELDEKRRMLELNELAQRFFRDNLKAGEGAEARAYLKKRGIPERITEEFGLGFAPPKWTALLEYLERKGADVGLAQKVGLVKEGVPSGRLRDHFVSRITFPIRDTRGKIIGFGGRIIGDGEPKYLNSPESPVFNKSSTLYGLYEARADISARDQAIVVEGYFDLLAVVSKGIREVVAPLGTALTTSHLRVLKRIASRVVLLFDADEAGLKAATRVVPLALAEGVDTRVALLPAGMDPDEFLKARSPDDLTELVGRAEPALDFYLERLLRERAATTPEEKRYLLNDVVPILEEIKDPILRSLYSERVAWKLGVKEDQISSIMFRRKRKEDDEGPDERREPFLGVDGPERLLVKMMIFCPEAVQLVKETGLLRFFCNSKIAALASRLVDFYDKGEDLSPSLLMNIVEDDLKKIVGEMLICGEEEKSDAKQIAENCVYKIVQRQIHKEIEAVNVSVKRAEQKNDYKAVTDLLRKKQKLISILRNKEQIYRYLSERGDVDVG